MKWFQYFCFRFKLLKPYQDSFIILSVYVKGGPENMIYFNLNKKFNSIAWYIFILRGTRNLSFLTYIKCIIFLFIP